MADAMLGGQITKLRQRRTSPFILELDLTQGINQGPPADPVAALLARRKTRLADVLDGLRRARQDDRVKAVVAKVGGQHIACHGAGAVGGDQPVPRRGQADVRVGRIIR